MCHTMWSVSVSKVLIKVFHVMVILMLYRKQMDLFPFLEDISPQTHLGLTVELFLHMQNWREIGKESNIVWSHWSSGRSWHVGSENMLKHWTLELFKDRLLSCFLKFEISPDICHPSFLFFPSSPPPGCLGFSFWSHYRIFGLNFHFFPTRIAVPASIKFHLKTQIYGSSSIKILKSSPFRL